VADDTWDWRKLLPPVPTFSFFGTPTEQAAGAYPTAAPTGMGPAATPAVLGTKPGDPVTMPSGVPTFGFGDPNFKPAAQAAQQVAAGTTPSAQSPADKFNADLLAKVKRGDFNGAIGALGKAMGGGGSAASAGSVPSPHANPITLKPLSPPEPIKAPAQRMMQSAIEQAGNPLYDLTVPLGKRRKEQARYDVLAKGGG